MARHYNKLAQVHRFADFVAVYVGNGGTTYVSAKEAERLGLALLSAASDIATYPKFIDSDFKPVEIPIASTPFDGK